MRIWTSFGRYLFLMSLRFRIEEWRRISLTEITKTVEIATVVVEGRGNQGGWTSEGGGGSGAAEEDKERAVEIGLLFV